MSSLHPALTVVPAAARSDRAAAQRRRRQLSSKIFAGVCWSVTALAFILLWWLLLGIWRDGAHYLDLQFLNSFPSRFPARAGIKSALWGSIWVILCTALSAIPVGVAAAIYLQEYAGRHPITRVLQVIIANLAGVPSIVYGMLGLALFVRALRLERSVLAGGLTLALLILPVIIIATQEALRAVPDSLRFGSLALGATRWQTIRRQVLPVALPGIFTGIILALARALGETAPLILMGGLTYVAFVPAGPLDSFTALPIQIFNWTSRPQPAFQHLAAAGSLALLMVLMLMNGVAVYLRYRFQKRLM